MNQPLRRGVSMDHTGELVAELVIDKKFEFFWIWIGHLGLYKLANLRHNTINFKAEQL